MERAPSASPIGWKQLFSCLKSTPLSTNARRQCLAEHLSRAEWMIENGYQHLLRRGVQGLNVDAVLTSFQVKSHWAEILCIETARNMSVPDGKCTSIISPLR